MPESNSFEIPEAATLFAARGGDPPGFLFRAPESLEGAAWCPARGWSPLAPGRALVAASCFPSTDGPAWALLTTDWIATHRPRKRCRFEFSVLAPDGTSLSYLQTKGAAEEGSRILRDDDGFWLGVAGGAYRVEGAGRFRRVRLTERLGKLVVTGERLVGVNSRGRLVGHDLRGEQVWEGVGGPGRCWGPLAAGDGSVVASFQASPGAEPDRLVRVDPTSGEVLATRPTEGRHHDLAVAAPDHAVRLSVSPHAALTILDLRDLSLEQVPLEGAVQDSLRVCGHHFAWHDGETAVVRSATGETRVRELTGGTRGLTGFALGPEILAWQRGRRIEWCRSA